MSAAEPKRDICLKMRSPRGADPPIFVAAGRANSLGSETHVFSAKNVPPLRNVPEGPKVVAGTMKEEEEMKRFVFVAAIITAVAAPAFADDVGVRAGPVGAGVTVGESHDHDRDRDRVVKERERSDSKTVIKKEDDAGNREKTVIHHDRD
jgi:hypothetical protein